MYCWRFKENLLLDEDNFNLRSNGYSVEEE